jgi:radical SAM protein with 4Fe4S-binding SPASM domain
MSLQTVLDLIDQAAQLGARTVAILGGEPLCYPWHDFLKVLDKVTHNGMSPVIFTNGTLITSQKAREIYGFGASVIAKLNSFSAKVQSQMTGGGRDSLKRMMHGVDHLLAAGFASERETRLGVNSVVSGLNLHEIPALWLWMRSNNIYPYIELIKMQGRADAWEPATISRQQAQQLFFDLLEIDQREFGYSWQPIPPRPASQCKLFYYGCYVTSAGNVQPCAGVSLHAGNIQLKSLESILSSPLFNTVRQIDRELKGKCAGCNRVVGCYGCRGDAFQRTGDFCAADPICWWQ